jgi:hypothetical protein
MPYRARLIEEEDVRRERRERCSVLMREGIEGGLKWVGSGGNKIDCD